MMWTNPLYSRDPVDQRHGRYTPRFRTVEPRHGMVESPKKVTAKSLSDPCWTGWCKKCGKPLISAVDSWDAPTDKYECGIC